MVKAEENDPDALVAALKAGDMYATTGPELRGIHWEDTQVVMESSAVVSVIVQAQGSATAVTHGPSMTRTTVKLGRCVGSPWLRVTVIDAAGRRAWSNPVFRDG